MKMRILLIFLLALLSACNKLDDYMLGKDNTPKPAELKEIQSKLNISSIWLSPIGSAYKKKDYLKLKPQIQNNIIYVANPNGMVKALYVKDGKEKWLHQIKQEVVSGPTVVGPYVAVSTNTSSLVVLDKQTGRELWRAKSSSEILAPVAIGNEKLIAKTIDGKVLTYSAATGKLLWSIDHGAPNLILKASASPVIVGSMVLIGFADGKLEAFDVNTGRTIWQRSIGYAAGSSDVERLVDIDADPIVRGDIAYLASYQGYVGALSLSSGEFIWRKPASVYKDILLNGNILYVTDSKDVLWSFDSKTGQINWKQPALKARGLTSPVLVGKNTLAVGDQTGYIHFFTADTGRLIGRQHLAAGIDSMPASTGNDLYVLTNNGMLNKLGVSTQ